MWISSQNELAVTCSQSMNLIMEALVFKNQNFYWKIDKWPNCCHMDKIRQRPQHLHGISYLSPLNILFWCWRGGSHHIPITINKPLKHHNELKLQLGMYNLLAFHFLHSMQESLVLLSLLYIVFINFYDKKLSSHLHLWNLIF